MQKIFQKASGSEEARKDPYRRAPPTAQAF